MDAASVFQKMTAVLHNVNKHAKKFTTITKAIHGGVRSKFKGVDLQYLKQKLTGKSIIDLFSDPELHEFFNLLLLLICLRNVTLNLAHRHIFAQIFSGHRDMRDMYQLMLELNHVASKTLPRKKGMFTQLLLKRICGYSLPVMFPQCSAYFHQSLDELKLPIDQRPAQGLLKVRYDMSDIKVVGIDMMHLQNPIKFQMLSNSFTNVEQEYLPEQFYPSEFRPLTHLRSKMLMAQTEAAFALKEKQEATFFQTVGLFAIGYSKEPTSQLKQAHEIEQNNGVGEKNQKEKYLKEVTKLKRDALKKALEKSQIPDKEKPNYSLDLYNWSLRLWVFETNNACLRQGGCSSRTQIKGRSTIDYDPFQVSQLPYFFGDSSICVSKQLLFFNEMDDSIHGMNLCIDTLKFPNQKNSLALINYSCNGWSLRLQLLPNRKWLLSQNLVFEIDPPELEVSEDDFEHFCYEIILTTQETEDVTSPDRKLSGKVHSWTELDHLYILLREFESKEVVEILRPGDVYDAIQFVIWDPQECKDVTQSYLDGNRPEISKVGLELCLVNYEAESQNIWVWARDVIPLPKEQERLLEKYPIQYFATYFKFNPLFAEKDLKRAPTRELTGADVVSFGIQRFRLLIEGVYDQNQLGGKAVNKGRSIILSQLMSTASTCSTLSEKEDKKKHTQILRLY